MVEVLRGLTAGGQGSQHAAAVARPTDLQHCGQLHLPYPSYPCHVRVQVACERVCVLRKVQPGQPVLHCLFIYNKQIVTVIFSKNKQQNNMYTKNDNHINMKKDKIYYKCC